jgi:hypothetical protein
VRCWRCCTSPARTWHGKAFDWAALDRLHVKGLIDDLKNKNTSVGLTDEGVADAAAAFARVVGRAGDAR